VSAKKQVPVAEALFTWPSQAPQLIASKCTGCGEIVFPAQRFCPKCCTETAEEVLLSRRGKLYSFSIQRHRPPGYKGPDSSIPFGVGQVELADGVILVSVLTENDPAALKIGMDMEVVIEKIFEDEEGNDVMCFKFKPIKEG
jgi:uncharacterized OB-fold protein